MHKSTFFLMQMNSFLAYKLLFSTPKLFRKKKSFLCYDWTPGSFEWRWITELQCSWMSPQWLLVSPGSKPRNFRPIFNHLALTAVSKHWGDLEGEGRCGFTRTDGQTATEHRHRRMPGTWSFQQIWQQIIWEMRLDFTGVLISP